MQVGFLDDLVVRPTAVSGDWELVQDFRYVTFARRGKPEMITVIAGFVTDFASIPKPARIIYESWGAYGEAAVVHDYLCVHIRGWSRAQVDRVFLEAMQASGVGPISQRVLYGAVVAFGAIRFGWNYRRVQA